MTSDILPFEYSGVISQWQLTLPSDVPQFDFDTIADVILHIRYTAREGGVSLKAAALANLKAKIAGAQTMGSTRLFSMRHEFPTEWAKFKGAASGTTASLSITSCRGISRFGPRNSDCPTGSNRGVSRRNDKYKPGRFLRQRYDGHCKKGFVEA